MIVKALKRAGLGFLAGMIIGTLICIFEGLAFNDGNLFLPSVFLDAAGSEAGALLLHMLVSGVFGIFPMTGTIVYELDSWSLLKQAAVHYSSYTVAFMIIGSLAGWIEPFSPNMAIMAGIFAVAHIIIWLIMYARYKTETDQLNELLEERQRTEST